MVGARLAAGARRRIAGSMRSLSNAVVHARVQVEVDWGTQRFMLRVRDDGVGLDARTIARGREGHWGLQGIR